jgi:hypothetical protein
MKNHAMARSGKGKTREGRGVTLLGRRQTIIGVVPGVKGKTKAWLIAATITKVLRRKWPKWLPRGGKEKLGRKMVFS